MRMARARAACGRRRRPAAGRPHGRATPRHVPRRRRDRAPPRARANHAIAARSSRAMCGWRGRGRTSRRCVRSGARVVCGGAWLEAPGRAAAARTDEACRARSVASSPSASRARRRSRSGTRPTAAHRVPRVVASAAAVLPVVGDALAGPALAHALHDLRHRRLLGRLALQEARVPREHLVARVPVQPLPRARSRTRAAARAPVDERERRRQPLRRRLQHLDPRRRARCPVSCWRTTRRLLVGGRKRPHASSASPDSVAAASKPARSSSDSARRKARRRPSRRPSGGAPSPPPAAASSARSAAAPGSAPSTARTACRSAAASADSSSRVETIARIRWYSEAKRAPVFTSFVAASLPASAASRRCCVVAAAAASAAFVAASCRRGFACGGRAGFAVVDRHRARRWSSRRCTQRSLRICWAPGTTSNWRPTTKR